MNNIKELKEQLKQGVFYYYKSNLMVNAKVYNIVSYDDGELEIFFTGGIVGVYKDKLTKVKRPANILGSFKWCYSLKNEDDAVTGYIGLKDDEESTLKQEKGNNTISALCKDLERIKELCNKNINELNGEA